MSGKQERIEQLERALASLVRLCIDRGAEPGCECDECAPVTKAAALLAGTLTESGARQ